MRLSPLKWCWHGNCCWSGMGNQQRKEHQMASRVKAKSQAPHAQVSSCMALGAVALMDVTKALQEGLRVSIMFGRIDLERGDEEVAWIGDTLAKVCGNFHVDIAVCDDPRFNKIGLEICRRVRRIEKEGVPYGIAAGIKELGSESPYRGIDLTNNFLDEDALSVATARMESIVWNQNVWPVLVQLTDEQTMLGFLAGHHALPCDEEGRPLPVDAAVAFLNPDGSTSCGYIRSFKSEAVALGVTPRPKPDWLSWEGGIRHGDNYEL